MEDGGVGLEADTTGTLRDDAVVGAEPGFVGPVEPTLGFEEDDGPGPGVGGDGAAGRFGEVGLPRSTEPFPGVGVTSPSTGITGTTGGRSAPTPSAVAGGLVLLGLLGLMRRLRHTGRGA